MLSDRSSNCIQQDHNNCNGMIIDSQMDNAISRICNCPCHNNMYQLIKKASSASRINESDNYFDDKI
ncbi:MAG TPA: hypothetical protein VFM28_01170 [Nitrososphaeraceae archaeon]|nr:hypothetical protein [Nitrososphaeraceae archaeon]